MKIYKNLNIIVVKDKKLDIFKSYKIWFLFFIVLSVMFSTVFVIKII